MAAIEGIERRIVGGVDTHKDLHVAAVVDDRIAFWELKISPPPASVLAVARSDGEAATAIARMIAA